MNRLLSKANQRVTLGSAAALLAGTALLGQVLGFFRLRIVLANFLHVADPAKSSDIFFAAFKIPDLVYFTLTAGALGVAFMPFLSDRLEKGDRKGMWDLASSLINLLAIVMGALAVIILIFAEPLVHVVAPNMTPAQVHNAALLMRIISLNPLIFSISAVLTSVQQTFGRFFFYAIAPLFYNTCIIVSAFLFKNNLGVIGLGIGAVVGALLQLFVVSMGLFGLKVRYATKILWQEHDFRRVLRTLPPRSLDQGIDQLNSIAETRFARRLGDRYISFYESAYTLHNAPVALIGTAISTAAFPRFTERLSQGRPDLFRKEFLEVLRAMIWLSLPVVVICYFARGYMARLLAGNNAPEVALIFGFLTVAILFRTIYAIVSRYFYAQKNTKVPLIVSLVAIGLNIFLAYYLSKPTSYGVSGLAIAQSIVAATEVAILSTVMVVHDPKLLSWKFLGGLLKIFSITGFSIIVAYTMVTLFPLRKADLGVGIAIKLVLISIVTIMSHVCLSWLFDLEESRPIIKKLRRIILRPVRIQ